MAVKVHINADANGKTLKVFGDVLAKRMAYMHESADKSVAAMVIDALKSLRAATTQVKASKIKVDVVAEPRLVPSMWRKGKALPVVCLRVGSSHGPRYTGPEKMLCVRSGAKFGDCQVYRHKDLHTSKEYLIVAPDVSSAKKYAQEFTRRRALRYAGLAKKALTVLMMKTAATTDARDAVTDPIVALKASEVTTLKTIKGQTKGTQGTYGLLLDDNLRYAMLALKGGAAMVDTCIKKACNSTTGKINKMLQRKGFLDADKLPTPFPEIKKKK
jgi:hypothetical protein